MSEQEAFHAQMAADPNDATVRAIYADWLDEHDQPEAARRLRWWSKVLPHMPKSSMTATGEKRSNYRRVTLPEWAQHVVLAHFPDSRGMESRLQEELHGLGLAGPPEGDYTPAAWINHFRSSPGGWDRVEHLENAQKIAEKIGEPVKLAAIPPAGSTGSELVRVPVPTPVQPKERVAPVAQPSQPPNKPTQGPTFILPG